MFSPDDHYNEIWIESQFLLGELDHGHVWLRTVEFVSPCSCGAGQRPGRVEGVFTSEREARKGFEDDHSEDEEHERYDCGDGKWIRMFKRIEVPGLAGDR